MADTYLAIFARGNGRTVSDVGENTLHTFEGDPLDRVFWNGETWVRVSDLRNGEVHYIPEAAVSLG